MTDIDDMIKDFDRITKKTRIKSIAEIGDQLVKRLEEKNENKLHTL